MKGAAVYMFESDALDVDTLKLEPVSLLDSEFDSAWAPPVTLRTQDSAPVLLEGWRVTKQGVR